MDTELLYKFPDEQHQQENMYWDSFLLFFQMFQNHDYKLKKGSAC